ncbi:MAG: UDP-N-acetylmuramoyl-tripeptide--D-alanyl-D-alanine ligase [Verrucomicrobia bacterium]|nr:UDP-N-acetylmuramoyl-tripeptide--D-alanyl-D-alanine ligase [Verrucomicrobiota bacterium]
MDARSLKFFADACNGEILRGDADAVVKRVSTDSRDIRPGDLFVALAGDKFDGHSFLADVANNGVSAVMVERAKVPPATVKCAVIAVENTRRALGEMAARYRQDFTLPVIAVGGSNGKTTTKELIAAVLREKFNALWSEASFNNDIGVPLTLLKLERSHGAAVFEAGTNHPGELAPLVRMIQPSFGVVTSLGREHLEFFGDMNGVAQEEGWLAELLPADGTLFVNGDNPGMDAVTRRAKCRVVRAGFGLHNDWRANDARFDERGTTFDVATSRAEFSGEYRLALLGRHQVVNALLAMAVGAELGLTRDELRRALAGCTPPKMRLQVSELNGVRVLDDAYNANADSMLAALRTLGELPCSGRRIAVLGDMAELGEHSAAAHAEVGRSAAELGVQILFAVGRWANTMAGAAKSAGLGDVRVFSEVPAAAEAVKAEARAGDWVLLKASRATALERVAAVLKAK